MRHYIKLIMCYSITNRFRSMIVSIDMFNRSVRISKDIIIIITDV